MVTATSGFVRQYRVVVVKDLDGGLHEATVRALFVDPRAGGATAMLVTPPKLSLADKTKSFQIGPKARLSGGELAAKLKGVLASALASANRFYVLTPESLGKAIAVGKLSEKMVEEGLAPGSDLLRACESATADYILSSTLEDVKWTSKLGMDKASGRFAPQRKLSLAVKLSLFSVRKASVVTEEVVAVSLGEPEIAELLEADEDADLLHAALKKVSASVEAWIDAGK
jgi:hypothetical protein